MKEMTDSEREIAQQIFDLLEEMSARFDSIDRKLDEGVSRIESKIDWMVDELTNRDDVPEMKKSPE